MEPVEILRLNGPPLVRAETFDSTFDPGLITIVIPVLHDASGLRATLESLRQHKLLTHHRVETIIASDVGDEVVAEVCSNFPVSVITGDGGGSYSARNHGVRHSRGEHLVFIDADVEITSSWFDAVREAVRQRLDYGGGPIVVQPRAELPNTHNLFMRIFEFPVEYLFAKFAFFPTGNMLVRRETFCAIGGFDERLRSGGDVEFGTRLAHRAQQARITMNFIDGMTVRHPMRSPGQFASKLKRQALGHHALGRLFPACFPYYTPRSFPRHVLIMLFGFRDFMRLLNAYTRESHTDVSTRQVIRMYLMGKVHNLRYLRARAWYLLADWHR